MVVKGYPKSDYGNTCNFEIVTTVMRLSVEVFMK
jgi:hypothetical protein